MECRGVQFRYDTGRGRAMSWHGGPKVRAEVELMAAKAAMAKMSVAVMF
jgi:hypothetical protein